MILKINWIFSPESPYYMDSFNPYKKGNSSILEIPASSFIAGYQGTTMRISPSLNDVVGNYIYAKSKRNQNPVVFLFQCELLLFCELCMGYSQ